MLVLVTGGSGFVGEHLVARLGGRGDGVRVLDVARGDEAGIGGIELVEGDVRDAELVDGAVRGVDAVVHMAAVVSTRRSHAEHVRSVVVDGSANVVRACRRHGVARLVDVSSASVVYGGKDIRGGDETLPYAPRAELPYEAAKIVAERRMLECSDERLATCAIRPHQVYGPGDHYFAPALLHTYGRRRMPFGVGSATNRADVTYVGNLVDALVAAIDRLAPGSPLAGQAYFVTDGAPLASWELVRMFLTEAGIVPPRRPLPFAVAYGLAAAAEALAALKPGEPPEEATALTRWTMRYLYQDHWFHIDKARRDLGYDPRVSVEDGIRRAVAALPPRGRRAPSKRSSKP